MSKKGEVHPIVRQALEMAYEWYEPVYLDEEAIEELKHSLKQLFGHPDLYIAVVDLINLAAILKKENSPKAAMGLIEVVATAADALNESNDRIHSKSE
ncbi:MAG: hypothetical protein HWN66_06775 [Candidatus Helarchaeota archaeon]|nr:hypothetical protein [Candidatus Helarchaeota archaeon]